MAQDDGLECPFCHRPVSASDAECPLCGEELPTSSPAAGPPTVPLPPKADAPQERRRTFTPVAAAAGVIAVGLLAVGGYALLNLTDEPENGTDVTSLEGSSEGTDDVGASPSVNPAESTNITGQAGVYASSASAPSTDDSGNTVTYDATNLIDGDATTAWRTDGDGSGATLTFRFDHPFTVTALALINGYTKEDPATGADRYREERRILLVRWSFSNGPTVEQTLMDDERQLQPLYIDPVVTEDVTLTITSTTEPGDPDRNYTACSEVVILGQ
jgi:hypothetical protein